MIEIDCTVKKMSKQGNMECFKYVQSPIRSVTHVAFSACFTSTCLKYYGCCFFIENVRNFKSQMSEKCQEGNNF